MIEDRLGKTRLERVKVGVWDAHRSFAGSLPSTPGRPSDIQAAQIRRDIVLGPMKCLAWRPLRVERGTSPKDLRDRAWLPKALLSNAFHDGVLVKA